MLGAGGVTIDNDIMPQRSQKQFLRGPVAISDLNTWATAVVGPHSFAAKYHVGRARPEVRIIKCFLAYNVYLVV